MTLDHASTTFVAGGTGLVGGSVVRALDRHGFEAVLSPTRDELDLADAQAVRSYFEKHRPRYVVLAAAKVGGILANQTYPGDFIHQNLQIQQAVIHSALLTGVERLVFLGSSCIYPKHSPQPIPESALLTGPLEETNLPYAIAKIAGVTQCQAYRRQHGVRFVSAMPTNLYGPGDNFDLETSHVLPALLRKCHEAKEAGLDTMTLWGSGSPKREFLHVDDLAEAVLFLLEHYDGDDPINVGTGSDISILDLAQLIADVVGFEGRFEFDRSKPDGTPRKLLDVSRLAELGWTASIGLEDGIRSTYEWYLDRAGV